MKDSSLFRRLGHAASSLMRGGSLVFYEPHMLESIKRVEATRSERLGQQFSRLTADEKAALLKGYHPDYKAGTMRELAVGPNTGDRVPHELADLLEGASRIDPDAVDLGHADYDVDILVIGGGGAGTSAAMLAHQRGATVLLTTKLRLGDANTMMAQGGIQAADKPNDSPAIHLPGRDGRRRLPEHSGVGAGADPRCARRHEVAGGPGGHVRQGVGRHHGFDPRGRDVAPPDALGPRLQRRGDHADAPRRVPKPEDSTPRIHLRRGAGSRLQRDSAPGRSSTTWRRASTGSSGPRR